MRHVPGCIPSNTVRWMVRPDHSWEMAGCRVRSVRQGFKSSGFLCL